jgi:hypothetical protein
LNRELQAADDMARSAGDPPPTEGSWVAYRDAAGMDWILWSAADGRLCHWEALTSMMGCATGPPKRPTRFQLAHRLLGGPGMDLLPRR